MSNLRLPPVSVPPAPPTSTVIEPEASFGGTLQCYSVIGLESPATSFGYGGGCAARLHLIEANNPDTQDYPYLPSIGIDARYQSLIIPDASNTADSASLEKTQAITSIQLTIGHDALKKILSTDGAFSFRVGSFTGLGGFFGESCGATGQCVPNSGIQSSALTEAEVMFAFGGNRAHRFGISAGFEQSSLYALDGINTTSRTLNLRLGLMYSFAPPPTVGMSIRDMEQSGIVQTLKVLQYLQATAGSIVGYYASGKEQGLANDIISDVTEQGGGLPSAEIRDRIGPLLPIPRLLASAPILNDFATARDIGWRWTFFALQLADVATTIGLYADLQRSVDNREIGADLLGAAVGGTVRLASMLNDANGWVSPSTRFMIAQALSGLCGILAQMPIGPGEQVSLWEAHVALQTDLFVAPSMRPSDLLHVPTTTLRFGIGGYYHSAQGSGSRGYFEMATRVQFPSWATAIELSMALSAPQLSIDNLLYRMVGEPMPGSDLPVSLSSRIGVPVRLVGNAKAALHLHAGGGFVSNFQGTNLDWGFELYANPEVRWTGNTVDGVAGINLSGGLMAQGGYFMEILPYLGLGF